MAWFVVQTQPRSEALAERNIRALGLETFFPHLCEWKPSGRNKSKLAKEAYFPRYLFVEMALGRERFDRVNRADGVKGGGGVLCASDAYGNKTPFPIPGPIMDAVKKLADHSGLIMEAPNGRLKSRRFGIGERVRFNEDHPLFGFPALVEELLDDGKSLRVRLEGALLGKSLVTTDEKKLAKA